MRKAIALVLLASLAMAGLVQADLPPAGLNCHRSCYSLDLAKGLPIKQSIFKACGAAKLGIVIKGARRRDPKKPVSDRSVGNAFGCGTLVEYKFPQPQQLVTYQSCEHSNPIYVSQLEKYKIALPPGPPRDFRC